MARRERLLICEGRDDLAAFRMLIRADWQHLKEVPASDRKRLHFQSETLALHVLATEGKGDLASRAAKSPTADFRPDQIAVNFDPDQDGKLHEFKFFISAFDELARGARGKLNSIGQGGYQYKERGRDISVLPAPWRLENPAAFDDLPDEHCLERVLITGILDAGAHHRDWVESAVSSLRDVVGDHGWKRAFRIWNAALHPETDSFVDRLLQDAATKTACLEALRRTTAFEVLVDLLK